MLRDALFLPIIQRMVRYIEKRAENGERNFEIDILDVISLQEFGYVIRIINANDSKSVDIKDGVEIIQNMLNASMADGAKDISCVNVQNTILRCYLAEHSI